MGAVQRLVVLATSLFDQPVAILIRTLLSRNQDCNGYLSFTAWLSQAKDERTDWQRIESGADDGGSTDYPLNHVECLRAVCTSGRASVGFNRKGPRRRDRPTHCETLSPLSGTGLTLRLSDERVDSCSRQLRRGLVPDARPSLDSVGFLRFGQW